jgi:hypothetical protein
MQRTFAIVLLLLTVSPFTAPFRTYTLSCEHERLAIAALPPDDDPVSLTSPFAGGIRRLDAMVTRTATASRAIVSAATSRTLGRHRDRPAVPRAPASALRI